MIKGALRFKPDPMDCALIDFAPPKNDFQASHIGLILNESYTGSALLLNTLDSIREGQELRVKIGRVGPLKAKVVWVKAIEDSILKVGVQYEEESTDKASGKTHVGSHGRPK